MRFTDIDGQRFVCFATARTRSGQFADLELSTAVGHLARYRRARRSELRLLRLRICSADGRLVRGDRRLRLRIAGSAPSVTSVGGRLSFT